MEKQEHGTDVLDTKTGEVTRKSDGSDGPPLLRVVKNENTPGALNSALKETSAEGDEVDPNHPCTGRAEIVDADKGLVREFAPDGSEIKKFAICGFASSTRHAIPLDDPSWSIWTLNQFYRHCKRSSRHFDLHWNWDSENVPGTDHKGWIRGSGIPVFMIDRHDELPTSVRYPIERMIAKFGDYYTSTVAEMLALAIDEIDQRVEAAVATLTFPEPMDAAHTAVYVASKTKAFYDEFTIGIFGIDLVVGEEYFWQKACAEYYIGIAIGRGIRVMIPPNSALCKQHFRYGWHTEPQQIVKPREVEKHKAMVTAERDELLKKLYMMEGALQVLEAPLGVAPKDTAAIRVERDETMKRALMLEGALEADRYWGDLVELRLRGADVRL